MTKPTVGTAHSLTGSPDALSWPHKNARAPSLLPKGKQEAGRGGPRALGASRDGPEPPVRPGAVSATACPVARTGNIIDGLSFASPELTPPGTAPFLDFLRLHPQPLTRSVRLVNSLRHDSLEAAFAPPSAGSSEDSSTSPGSTAATNSRSRSPRTNSQRSQEPHAQPSTPSSPKNENAARSTSNAEPHASSTDTHSPAEPAYAKPSPRYEVTDPPSRSQRVFGIDPLRLTP